jgi:hypothetical protein
LVHNRRDLRYCINGAAMGLAQAVFGLIVLSFEVGEGTFSRWDLKPWKRDV